MLADIIPKIAAMEQDHNRPYYPRPSQASPGTPDDPGRCIRAMTYHRLGVPPAPWPGRFILVLDDSSWHEELTLDWLAKTAHTLHSRQLGVDYALPAPLGQGGFCRRCRHSIPNMVLHGHIDALFTDLLGIDRLLEHKAVNRFRYEELLEGDLPLDYLTQCCLYLGGLRALNPDLRDAVLLIKNKDTSAYLEFQLTYDDDIDRCTVTDLVASDGTYRAVDRTLDGLVAAAIDKFRAVETAADRQTLPPRPYRRDSWRCDYCSYGARCWSGYTGEVADRERDAELPQEMAPILAAYKHASTTKGDCDTVMKRLRPQVLAALEAANIKNGVSGDYKASVTVQDRASLDESLIPDEIKAAATIKKPVETLRVTNHPRAVLPESTAL